MRSAAAVATSTFDWIGIVCVPARWSTWGNSASGSAFDRTLATACYNVNLTGPLSSTALKWYQSGTRSNWVDQHVPGLVFQQWIATNPIYTESRSEVLEPTWFTSTCEYIYIHIYISIWLYHDTMCWPSHVSNVGWGEIRLWRSQTQAVWWRMLLAREAVSVGNISQRRLHVGLEMVVWLRET